jgi:dienelactone hydrolase
MVIMVLAVACRGGITSQRLGSPQETLSDADYGAAAAAVDAMDHLWADQHPDTDSHLQLTPTQVGTADDSTRADLLLVAMRSALRKYADVRVAAADGFREMPSTDGKHTLHHLSNWGWAKAETRRFDPAKPTSLIYREGGDGTLALVGAMYTAPANSSIAQLDQRIPLGLARWHQHVNWCAPKVGSGRQWLEVRDGHPAYGPRSPVDTRDACDAAGGVFYPRVFGWMVHVTIAGSDDPSIVWNGGFAPVTGDSTLPHDTAVGLAVAARTDTAKVPDLRLRPRLERRLLHANAAQPTSAPGVAPLLPQSSSRPVAAPASQPSAPVARPPAPITPVAGPPSARPPGGGAGEMIRPPPTVFAAGGVHGGSFMSGGATVSYTRYTPPGPLRHPAILLIHGEGGLAPQADHFQKMGASLAEHGYVVEVVSYFDRTATVTADPAQKVEHFTQWSATIQDALKDLSQSANVDSNRIGLLGFGLGGTLALNVGAQAPQVRAVVEFAGTLPVWTALRSHRMPAVFVAQTESDKPVPLREINRIRAACEAAQAPFELQMYQNDGAGHGLRGQASKEFGQKGVAFFDTYLKNSTPAS